MVEARFRKFCHEDHKSDVEFYCLDCSCYVCGDCSLEFHMDHFGQMKSVKAYFTERHISYINIHDKIDFMKTRIGSLDELKNKIHSQIEKAYDEFIQDIISYKGVFIEELGNKIFTDNLKFEGKFDIDKLHKKAELINEKVSNFLKDGKKKGIEDLIGLESPQELTRSLDGLIEKGKEVVHLNKFKITYAFKPERIKDFFNLSLPSVFIPQAESPVTMYHERGESDIIFYNMLSKKKFVSNIPEWKNDFPSFCLRGECLYICGGSSKHFHVDCKSFYAMHTHDGNYVRKRDMICSKYFHPLAAGLSHIYSAGGKETTTGKTTASCEKYSLSANKWNYMAELNKPRYMCPLTLFDQIALYVFAGYCGLPGSIEKLKLDTHHPKWELLDVSITDQMHLQSAQVSPEEILIFGNANYYFNTKTETLISFGINSPKLQIYNTISTPFKKKLYAMSSKSDLFIFDILLKTGQIINI